MWDWIVNILFELLKLIQTFAVDWGLSIIILVVIIRLLLTPLIGGGIFVLAPPSRCLLRRWS